MTIRWVSFFLGIFCFVSPALGEIENFKAANGRGAIGETGSLYLTPPGVFIRPFYNDFLGNTDKLLTYSMMTGLLGNLSENESIEFKFDWRFLTPSFKPEFGLPDLPMRVGRFADWMELQSSYASSQNFDQLTWKNQVTLGIGHIGNKGARQVQVAIHHMINQTWKHLSYDNQPEGTTLTAGYETALISPELMSGLFPSKVQISLGVFSTPLMSETYLGINYLVKIHSGFELAGEGRLIKQHSSTILEEPESMRYEVALGALISPYYQPSIKYVSHYLKEDPIGQIYLDFINLNLPL